MCTSIYNDGTLFKQLVRNYSSPIVLVHTLPVARKVCNLLPVLSLETTKIILRDYNDVDLVHKDIDNELLDTLISNEPIDDYRRDVKLTKWFTEWALKLSYCVRLERFKQYNIPNDLGIHLVFLHINDNLNTLKDINSNIILLVIVSNDSDNSTFIKDLESIFNPLPRYLIIHEHELEGDGVSLPVENSPCCTEAPVDSREDGDNSNVIRETSDLTGSSLQEGSKEAGVTHDAANEGCLQLTRRDVGEENVQQSWKCRILEVLDESIKTLNLSLTSNDVKRSGNKSIYKSLKDDDEVLNSTALLMYEELCMGINTTIQTICRCSIDNDIRALAYGYSGILKLYSNEIEEAIADLDRASSLYLKYGMKWDCVLYSLISAALSGVDGIQKFGTRCASLELKTAADNARAALCSELCALHCTKERKMMFQLVMAGHLYNQAGLQNLSKRCYLIALPTYLNSGWNTSSEHLYGFLSRYDPYYSINALNGLSSICEYNHCTNLITDPSEYDEDQSQNSSGDREISYLKRLMKLTYMNEVKDELKVQEIASGFNHYPSLSFELYKLPNIDNESLYPFPVRIPLVFLRNKEGVPGKNCYLITLETLEIFGLDIFKEDYIHDDFNLKEAYIYHILSNKPDRLWKRCKDFYDSFSKNVRKRETSKSSTRYFPLNTHLVLKLDFINPLHIPIHCDDFHLLICKGDGGLTWVKADILIYPYCDDTPNYLYFVEEERKLVLLKFKMDMSGQFEIKGIRWKLFSCVYFWTPIYLSGTRNNIGAPISQQTTELLDEFLGKRSNNNGLTFITSEHQPNVNLTFKERTFAEDENALGVRTPLLIPENFKEVEGESYGGTFKLFSKRDEFLQYDEMAMKHLVFTRTNEEGTCELVDVVDVISGEHMFTEMSITNVGDSVLTSISLRLKCIGAYKCPAYPIGYVSRDVNIKTSWCMTYGHNPAEEIIERISDVYFESQTLLKPKDVLKIYFFMVPLYTINGPNISLTEGKLTMYSTVGNVRDYKAFKRFYNIGDGISSICRYDYKFPTMLKCTLFNNSTKKIDRISYIIDDEVEIDADFSANEISFHIPAIEGENNLSLKWAAHDSWGVDVPVMVMPKNVELMLSVESSLKSLHWNGNPCVVEIQFNVINASKYKFNSCFVEAHNDSNNIWSFIGITKYKIPSIKPGEHSTVKFNALLPIPGVYTFTTLSINLKTNQKLSIASHGHFIVKLID